MASEYLIFFLILLSFATIAFLYSSVGHGGGSGYLALMSIFPFITELIRPTALLLNILVAGISTYYFYKNKQFRWELFYPFIITSIPFSFLGGIFSIELVYYKLILGVVLAFAAIRLFLKPIERSRQKKINIYLALLVGAAIGLLSGLLGIGGGIILSPLILSLSWATIKQTAAVSAPFVLVNSVSGIIGYASKGGTLDITIVLPVFLAVLVGAVVGSYCGSVRLNSKVLNYLLGVVLLIAVFKLFNTL